MIVYGKQIVLYILRHHKDLVNEIFFSKKVDTKLFREFQKLDCKIHNLDNKKAQAMAKGGNHQGYFLDIKAPQETTFKELKKLNFILVLDGLTDMGNIGAIMRSAYGLGVDGVIICGIKDIKLENIIRSSSGVLCDMKYLVSHNILDIASEFKQAKWNLIGASMDGDDITTLRQAVSQVALFVGNESTGFSKKLTEKLDYKVAIKMTNKLDSLNVSVATGILTHHINGLVVR